jgi:hypothetical protein
VKSPVIKQAFRIALSLYGKADPIVSVQDAFALETAVINSPNATYRKMADDPMFVYKNDGVGGHRP